MAKLILFNKPYDVLCQFTSDGTRATLADYLRAPECRDAYAAGRLDRDSEGLLLLTDNGQLQHQLAHPRHKEAKVYWAQVEGEISEDALDILRRGVQLNDGLTKEAKARRIDEPNLWPRSTPIRFRKNQPTSWLELTLREGKNRQVRRMTAAVGFPTLRLVRCAVGRWRLEDIGDEGTLPEPGQYRVIEVVAPKTPKQTPSPQRHKANDTFRDDYFRKARSNKMRSGPRKSKH